MIQEAYKVIKVMGAKEDQFWSIGSICPVEYKLNIWTRPFLENSKLFVFKTFVDAEREAIERKFGAEEIKLFKCLAENCSEAPKMITNLFDYLKLWRKDFDEIGYGSWVTPEGTILAERVKLIEEIKL